MYVIMFFVILIIAIVIPMIIASLMAESATRKGYDANEMHIFAWCFFFGIFGCIYVLSLPDKIIQQQNKEIIELLKAQQINKNNETDELPKL